ncbi:hypothetical protein OGV46_09175 [Citrobacter sp. Cf108]|uniref:hypothetical protein n=1 Tax=Citrobacter sp. Cf108 TaxID=2985063 RepID=UPI002575FDD4|nr:hypothetical protein [Citrobacter sp. Cf108]EKA2132035.1 hypothetical protein [Citrobacter freundii]MDM3178676.1 hypothetical protein [Citrobacter sp. Cf108]
MNYFDITDAVNQDDSLYYMPLSHEFCGYYKIKFSMYSFEILVSDVTYKGRHAVLFELLDEDDDQPSTIGLLEIDETIEKMIEHLKSIDSSYHEPIYKSVYEWALQLFYQ